MKKPQVAFCLTFFLSVSCSSVEKRSDREPASVGSSVEPSKKENFYLSALGGKDAARETISAAEDLLQINYLAEGYVDAYDKKLDTLAKAKKANPAAEFEPLASEEYRNVLRAWVATRAKLEKIEMIYESSLHSSRLLTTSFEEKEVSDKVVESLEIWLNGLSPSDRLQMLELVEHLKEIRQDEDLDGPTFSPHSSDPSNASTYSGKTSSRDIASRSDPFDWKELTAANLESQFAENRDEMDRKIALATRMKAAVVAKTLTPEMVAALPWRADLQREPSSSKNGKIHPSPGPEGNFSGKESEMSRGYFTFSFDDGPHRTLTNRLTKILKDHRDSVNTDGAPATFFVLSQNLLANRKVFDQTKKLGFAMNNHSYTHPNFSQSDEDRLNHEINDSHQVLTQALKSKYVFFRCPYGACINPPVPLAREMIANLGLVHAFWSIDSLDWKTVKRPNKVFSRLVTSIQGAGRGVILIHDIHDWSVEATRMILGWVKKQNDQGAGIHLISLETALQMHNR